MGYTLYVNRQSQGFCARHAAGYTPGMHLWPAGPGGSCWSGVSGLHCSDTPDDPAKAPVIHENECCLCGGTGEIELDEPELVPGERDAYGDEWSFVCQDAEWREAGECESCAECPGTDEHDECGDKCGSCDAGEHCIDGQRYEPETCECGEVVCDSWHEATAVIGHGTIMCLDCAEGRGIIRRMKPCDECDETGDLTPEPGF